MKVSVNIASYKRPKVKTLEFYPHCTVWVAESEKEAYIKENPRANIRGVPNEVQGNVARVRNYILDHTKEFDVVVMIDDDCSGIYRWKGHGKSTFLDEPSLLEMIEKNSIVAEEWGAKFWGMQVNDDNLSYRVYTPFSTMRFIGGPFQAFLKGNDLRYDELLPLKEDYDMTLQQLNKNRIALRFNMYYYKVKQAEQAGGCATMRNYDEEMRQLLLLQKKWGSKIVRFDKKTRSNKGNVQKKFDFNPIIKPPINGV